MITLMAGDAQLTLDPAAGGRVAQLTVDDLELLAHTGEKPTRWGSFVMAPWAGRIRRGQFTFDGTTYELPTDRSPPHAIHGTVLDQQWSVTDSSVSRATLACPLGEPWPWSAAVRQTITLAERTATFELSVHTDGPPFPASAGWHPWFCRRLARGAPVELGFSASSMLTRDDDGIPTGTRADVPPGPWDDCFDEVSWPVILNWADAMRLEVSADTRYVVVFDELPEAVCVEPQTGPPDALNLEPAVVTAEHPLVATMTWTWRLLG